MITKRIMKEVVNRLVDTYDPINELFFLLYY